MHNNFEFKARCENPDNVRKILTKMDAEYKGRDIQTDIYFNVPNGRLKLRKGNIENALVGYEREDYAGAKQSKVGLYRTEPVTTLEEILGNALGIKIVVEKKRDIYLIKNVKFHVDEVAGLGSFVEVEAIDSDGSLGIEILERQCNHYKNILGINDNDILSESYSDMLMKIS